MNPEQQSLISEISRNLVAEISPEELPLFRYQSEAYFKGGGEGPVLQEGKDDILGFGTGEAVTLLTPYVLPVVTEVVLYMTSALKESLKAESGPVINNAVRGLFARLQSGGKPKPTVEDTPVLEAPPEEASLSGPDSSMSKPTAPAASGMSAMAETQAPEEPPAAPEYNFNPAEIWEIAVEKGRKIHMKKADAEKLADSIVAGLVLSGSSNA